MFNAMGAYIRAVEGLNRVVGRFTMYLIFAMLAVLLYSSISKAFFQPSIWTLESAQFLMVAYFLMGGAYSMQLDAHVRMDLIYSRFSLRSRALIDVLTAGFLLFYLVMLLYGGFSSTQYALEYKETSYSSWSPQMAPIKVVMTVGILLMMLQAIANFFRDLGLILGREFP